MIKRDETKQSVSTNHGLLDQVAITGRESIFLFKATTRMPRETTRFHGIEVRTQATSVFLNKVFVK